MEKKSSGFQAETLLSTILILAVGSLLYIVVMLNGQISLANLSLLLGVIVILPQLIALWHPAKFREAVQKFPRATTLGSVLMLSATAWFLWNVKIEVIADFEKYKSHMLFGFGAVGVLACVYLRDFLAMRGLAVLLLLLAKLMVDTARLHPSEWRLLISGWAYAMIFMGMWLTISPWRGRDIMNWKVATDARIVGGGWFRIGFGILLIVLGLTVFSTPETQAGVDLN